MKVIDLKKELRYICRLLPAHGQRKSLAKHMVYLNAEIIDSRERGEPTKVMESTYDCLSQALEMMDAVRDLKVSIHGDRNVD